jgi:hypothetical protein
MNFIHIINNFLFDCRKNPCYILANNQIASKGTLIQRGGGTGPMIPRQPGNTEKLSRAQVPIPAE